MRRSAPTRKSVLAAAVAVAVFRVPALAGTSTNTAGPVQQGTSDGSNNFANNNPAEAISLSGSSALANFTTSPYFTYLTPQTTGSPGTITLHNGTGGAPTVYTAPGNAVSVQLASGNFTIADTGVNNPTATLQNHSALRVEWHQQGSVDGIYDLINDQIGYVGGSGGTPISDVTTRNPTTANPTYVNTQKFTVAAGSPLGGHTLGNATSNTYDGAYYNLATGHNLITTGPTANGQDRIQVGIGEAPVEIFSYSGTPSPFATPGSAGYGLGNPSRVATSDVTGNGVVNGRQALHDQSIANLSTNKIDPQTGANYAVGPWNTAGYQNLHADKVAVTATLFAANPGTGLSRLNLTDAQWLQTTGRLANGVQFNEISRVIDSGQRVTPALNTGIDPSWAVGVDDGGLSNSTSVANAQHSIGPNIKFSGKTSGTEAFATLANSRLAVTPIALSELSKANSVNPIRGLDLAFTAADPQTGGTTDDSQFVHLNFDNIVSGAYKLWYNVTYETIKAADANYATANPTIKGDNHGDVRAVLDNVLNAEANYQNVQTQSVANPADGLLNKGYLLPSLLNVEKNYDGGPTFTQSPNLTLQAAVKQSYGQNFTTDGTSASIDQTAGIGSYYGSQNASGVPVQTQASDQIKITDNNGASGDHTKGNWLFGNFNQNGTRDFSAVQTALLAAKALWSNSTDHSTSAFVGSAANNSLNSAKVTFDTPDNPSLIPLANTQGQDGTPGATKGDLVVLGDYNSDGVFDGKDINLLARGAALSDASGPGYTNGTLTTASGPNFGDQVRNGVLRKNAALDYVNNNTADAMYSGSTPTNASAFLRQTGRSVLTGSVVPTGASDLGANADGTHSYTWDPAGVNAFNKFDVNRDGKVDRVDAAIVDHFVGKDYTNLLDQLSATINVDGTLKPGNQKPISLVDVELLDRHVITATLDSGGTSDFKLIRDALGSQLVDGDTNFDGKVDFGDLITLARDYGMSGTGAKWSSGDFNLDGTVDFNDLVDLARHYGQAAPTLSDLTAFAPGFRSAVEAAFAEVPEPGSFAVIALVSLAILRRRRSIISTGPPAGV